MIESQVIRYGLHVFVKQTVIVNGAYYVERNLHLALGQILFAQLLVEQIIERACVSQGYIGYRA